uniref:hypothetical protein n=1 Tax=Pigmentiphaga litoralis TaxID=516702 RepID=UPI00389AFB5D
MGDLAWPRSRNERTAWAMALVEEATDPDLAAWPSSMLRRTDRILVALERTARAWDSQRDRAGQELWLLNHELLTDTRALRARLRPHLHRTTT